MIVAPLDWRVFVDEAIRRRKAEGLSQRALAALAGVSVPTVNAFEQGEVRLRFERVTAILEALGLFVAPGPPDSFAAFIQAARRRWNELVAPLPTDHPSRQSLGHSEQSYAIQGLETLPSPGKLRDILATMPKTSGWTPFWVPTREAIRPTIGDGLVECWLGRPDVDRAFNDAAHSDFWQVSRGGYAYLQRGYQEDGGDRLDPGTIFDLTLPIWRTAEVMLHACSFAKAVGTMADTPIGFTARYSGLEGRDLTAWAKRSLPLFDSHRSRTSIVDLRTTTNIAEIERDLHVVVTRVLTPLYERFDGFELEDGLVAAQVSELRHSFA